MVEQWSVADVASYLGVTRSTVTAYKARAGQMPEPDGFVGRTPWWHPATIRAWRPEPARDGRVGRPRRKPEAVEVQPEADAEQQ